MKRRSKLSHLRILKHQHIYYRYSSLINYFEEAP